MLPNFKIVIGTIMLAILLFAVTGRGVVIPDTYTRIGEMPEVGRPMMQRMVTDEPGQAQFQVRALTRRAGELDRLRERTAFEIESASIRTDEPTEPPKQAVITDPEPEAAPAAIPAVPALQPSGVMGTVAAAPPDPIDARAPARPADAPDVPAKSAASPDAPPPAAVPPLMPPLAAPTQVASLPPTADVKPPEAAPPAHATTQTKPSPLRRIAKASAPHRRVPHRARLAHSVSGAPVGGFGQGWYGQSQLGTR
jgi:hypothetical protein